MAIIPEQETIVQYVVGIAGGSQFAFDFYAPEATDITVYKQASYDDVPNPITNLLEQNTDYTVHFNASSHMSGGYILLTVPAVQNNLITIVRDVQASLNIEFANARSFSGETLDEALQRLLLIEQQNKNYAFQRNLSYQVNSYLGNSPSSIASYTQVPLLNEGEIWIGAAGGGVINVELEENPDITTLRGELANAQPLVNGAGLVGYYDVNSSSSTTVRAYLNYNKIFGTAGGTANALTLTIASSDEIAYYAGMEVKLLISTSNTAAATLNINGLGAKNIITATGSLVSAGEMVTGNLAELIYDGTNFRLLNPIASSSIPTGAILDFGGTTAPSGYLLCDGSTVLRADYPQLFAVIGTIWGAGDGSTNFVLPSFARRTTIGSGNNTWTSSFGTTVGTYGPTGAGIDDGANGAEKNTLTIPTMPNHDHAGSTVAMQTVNLQGSAGGVAAHIFSGGSTALSIMAEGDGNPHNNMQPSAVVTKMIKT